MTIVTILDKIDPSEEQIQRLIDLVGKKNLHSFHEVANPTEKQEILKRIGESEIVLTSWTDFPEDVISSLKNVKLISVVATGYSWINIQAAKNKGITVTNVPGYANHAVAELVFGLILDIYRGITNYSIRTKENDFSRNKQPGEGLFGRVLGIIGTGTIGSHVAQIGKGFGMKVIGFTKHPSMDRAKKLGLDFVDLKTLLSESDIISIHVPKTEETIGMIGKIEFSNMKKGSLFICTTEADVFDVSGLLNEIENGRLIGAAIDKPITQNKKDGEILAKNEKLILTPEIGFHTTEAFTRLVDISIDNVESYLKGQIQNQVE